MATLPWLVPAVQHAKKLSSTLPHGRIVDGCCTCVATRQSMLEYGVTRAVPEMVSDEWLEHEYAAAEVAVVEMSDRLDTVSVTIPETKPVNLDSEEAVMTAESADTLPRNSSDLLLVLADRKGACPRATLMLDPDEEETLTGPAAVSSEARILPPAEAVMEPATLSTVTRPPLLAATYDRGCGTVMFTTECDWQVPGLTEKTRVPQGST